MKIYELEFLPSAQREWEKLGETFQVRFRKKLTPLLQPPRVPSAKLTGLADCYKIKLRAAGYRIVVIVVAEGKRDRNAVYNIAAGRV